MLYGPECNTDCSMFFPWSFCEMVGLTWRLQDLTEGANKWIMTVEENMDGVILTLGGIKALLVHIVGKPTIEDNPQNVELQTLIKGKTVVRFNTSMDIETECGWY